MTRAPGPRCRALAVALAVWAAPAAAEDQALARYLAGIDVPAALALHDGELRRAGSGGRFYAASTGKTFVAALALRMAERGEVDLDAPVAPLLPKEVATGLGGLNGVTLARLLSMTAGLPEYLTHAYFDDAVSGRLDPDRPEALLRYAYGRPAEFAAGQGFSYVNTNYVLAQVVLERAGGAPLAELLRRHVFAPAGMTRSSGLGPGAVSDLVAGHSADFTAAELRALYAGPTTGDGPSITTADDLVRFWSALLIDRTLLEHASLDRMLPEMTGKGGYGLGIDCGTDPDLGRVCGHAGGFAGFVADARVALDLGLAAAVVIADGDGDTDLVWDVLLDSAGERP